MATFDDDDMPDFAFEANEARGGGFDDMGEGEYQSEVCPECGGTDFEMVYAGGSDAIECQSCGWNADHE